MNKEEIKKILGGIIFLSPKPVNIENLFTFLKKNIDIKKEEILEILEEIKNESKNLGINLISDGKNLQFVTDQSISNFIEDFFKMEIEKELSPAAIETLALISYAGPLTRSEIEILRGVNSSYILRELFMRGLIEREQRGGIFYYSPSIEFLKFFGIEKVSELPNFQEINEKIKNVLLKFKGIND
jgi:segregation and condensation protein B